MDESEVVLLTTKQLNHDTTLYAFSLRDDFWNSKNKKLKFIKTGK